MQLNQVVNQSKIDQREAQILLADTIGKERSYLYAHPEDKISTNHLLELNKRVKRRINGEPLAYILGYKEFYNLKFFVNKHVLIPRPETEDLVEKTVIYVKTKISNLLNVSSRQARTIKTPIKICDVGAGSGCIAIALAKALPKAKIFATDIDSKALSIAKKNAKLHSAEGKITFLKGDLLSTLPEKVDIIVANLPYVKTGNFESLDPQIANWEPRIALNGGRDGKKLYRKLFLEAPKYLNKGGIIFYELNGKVYQKSFE